MSKNELREQVAYGLWFGDYRRHGSVRPNEWLRQLWDSLVRHDACDIWYEEADRIIALVQGQAQGEVLAVETLTPKDGEMSEVDLGYIRPPYDVDMRRPVFQGSYRQPVTVTVRAKAPRP